MRTTFLLVVSLALIPTVHAEPEIKGTPTELANYLATVPKIVTVTGEAEIKVPADKAIIALRVRTESRSLQEAIRLNEQARAKIQSSLKAHGISPENVKVEKFSSTPKYSVFGDKVKSYTVENNVKITAHEEKEFQAAAQVADNSPEIHYEGITFEHSNKDQLKNEVLAKACANVGARKLVYEANLGVRLSPKGFAEIGDQPTTRRRNAYAQTGTAPSYAGKAVGFSPEEVPVASAASDISETMSSFGEITFRAEIAVHYSVENK